MEQEVQCKKCGSVDNYRTEPSGDHIKAICLKCDSYIKFLSQPNKEFLMPFGKHKGKPLESLKSEEDVKYLNWMLSEMKLGNNLKDRIKKHLSNGI
jgi:hypothetical protein